jgi:FkbM family methyltransferase
MRAIFRYEDEGGLVQDFLGNIKIGFFVDVGAAEPIVNSQTWRLEQLGWNGILIEPRPDYAQRLRQSRRAKVYEAACTSPRNRGTVRLNLLGGYSSLNDKLVVAGMRPQGAIEVKAMTLDEILIDAGAPSPIDFISIDAEGHEVQILDGFDLTRWRPRLILIEDHVLDLRLHRTLQSRGYTWGRRTGLNAWYLPAEAALKVGRLGWLQFFRKYYLSLPARRIRDNVRLVRAKLGIFSPQRDG